MRAVPTISPPVLLILAACGGVDRPAAGPTVRDSAGIVIVENTGPVWAEAAGWTVADSPSVSIGGAAGDPQSDMSQIVGVVRLSDGRLAVANGIVPDVRFFDAAGKHLLSVGRRGSGPGEYQALAGLLSFDGDSVLVADLLLRRMTALSAGGKTARTYALGSAGGMDIGERAVSLAIPVGAFPDGTVLGLVQGFRIANAPAGAYRDTAAYVRFNPDGSARDTTMRIPGIEMEQMMMSFQGREFSAPSPVPLGRMTAIGVGPGRIAAALNDHYEIELRDAGGRLARLVRVVAPAVPITAADQTTHRREQLDQLKATPGLAAMPEALMAQMRSRIEQAKYPATYPFVVDLRFDPAGNLWAGEVQRAGSTVRRYAVFDTTGALLGRVAMPEKFQPYWVGREAVAGVWKDADDVEYVRVHALRKGG